MSETHRDAAKLLHMALLNGAEFPSSLSRTMTMDDAYEVQFALLDLQLQVGESQAGWKVGLTAKAMQEQQGMHEPVFGHLLTSGQLPSPASLPFESLLAPGFENELCLSIKSDLSGPDVRFEDAAAAIGAVAPAIELIEKRGVFKDDLPLAMAGNAQQRAFITGEFIPFTPDMNLATVSVSVRVNGEDKETALGGEVLGNPIHSVIWLAAKLAQFGRHLKPGDMIMSGSFTKQYDLAKGDRIAASFSDIGSAEIDFP
jgi:2-keto-4-pentenoate hydratase